MEILAEEISVNNLFFSSYLILAGNWEHNYSNILGLKLYQIIWILIG